MSTERISIVGIGLTYPDTGSPAEFWDNVLAGRRAFRRLPDVRMNRADYYSPDPDVPDRFYADRAAVLRDYSFDRPAYKIAGSTYRSTDTTHWLALDVAARALTDAGFPDGEGLPRQTTGVVLGNSLTGEFSRANVMRLRWPYVRRTVAAALTADGWSEEQVGRFLHTLQDQYKAPFPSIDEDTLAGGLANTIAGRICNYFDLAGGGYTVDGACSSSLLSVATAANALTHGDLDVAIAGGVDLSIDPFELIGFAKTGALATAEMKVYDKHSNGFWPGEGAGALVLMREQDALERGARIYASITGWGVSSDGKGGMTRPEADGHRLAIRRAYHRAGYGVDTVSYFEGHGTGTALGDATEIAALSGARRDAGPTAAPAALGTVKGNFGHTKAAAGVAGLIKAALAVHHQVIPPVTGNTDAHPLLADSDAALYLPRTAELWPADQEIRAGVSAMGFGGINSHVTVERAPTAARRTVLDDHTVAAVSGRQDVEVLLFDADHRDGLRAQVEALLEVVPALAMAELTDLAGTLAARLAGRASRAAVVAGSAEDAERGLRRLLGLLDSDATAHIGSTDGVFLGTTAAQPRIGFLFPGQGSGRGGASALRRRFAVAEEVHRTAALTDAGDSTATEVAQPRIVSGSVAGLRVLDLLGITADVATGHSLGELTALHWGGAMDQAQVVSLAEVRGRVMAAGGGSDGAMAGLAVGPHDAAELGGEDVVIAGYNGPQQTVVSGSSAAIERACARARARGVNATRIPVSHAFHSPALEPAAAAMTEPLSAVGFSRLRRPVVSTVTGEVLHATEDLVGLLRDQIVLPVRFREAAEQVARRSDLLIEVGPGRVLTGLATQIAPDTPVLALDTDSSSLGPLMRVVGAAFVAGVSVDTATLFAGRVVRPLALDADMSFLTSPCEAAPSIGAGLATDQHTVSNPVTSRVAVGAGDVSSTLDLLRALAAERVELPVEELDADTHPLDDLHLSSITVGQIVNEVTRALGRPALEGMPNFATVCLGELAEMIDELAQTERVEDSSARGEVPGVAPWVRPFAVEHVVAARPVVDTGIGATRSEWSVFAPDGHPLAEPLRVGLAGAGIGDGVLLCLPADADESHFGLFLEAGRTVLAAPNGTRFVVVQQGLGASGLARTLRLEDPSTRTTIVELPQVLSTDPTTIADAVASVVAETAATQDYAEARYDASGVRWVPTLRSVTAMPPTAPLPLGPDDVLLVTGGGKGITAESALAVAADSGAKLVLLGRSAPADDPELAANLLRMDAAGLRYRYEQADVTSAEQVRAAVTRAQAALGPVTAVLHGAGRNEPGALFSLTEESFRSTAAPKVSGLRAVLDAVDEDRIKLLVTFGSIIGRSGLRGEAHYATANDWMTELTLRFGREHPQAKVLACEWSVWSGAGMGEKLGVVSALQRDGITPIPTEDGIAVLRSLLADPQAPPVAVVCGRTAGMVTLPVERTELPLHRFVDRVIVHYPGIELVTEADLSAGSDPYLGDHQLDGNLVFPAVIGMEAMTQVASALTGTTGVPVLSGVEFLRPITVRPGASTTIRLAALARDPETVDVVLRSEETGFSADHFRARLCFTRPALPDLRSAPSSLPKVVCDPVTELYGSVLFQGKRFQRLLAYQHAAARRAIAEVACTEQESWFATFLPQERLLADPGTRDVVMHAIQCCVPDATLLPQAIEELHLADRATADLPHVVLDARERSQDGDSYTYDVDVRDPDGRLVERWTGLVLRAIRSRGAVGSWSPAMLGPHLERTLETVLGGRRAVVVEPDPADSPARTTGQRRAQTQLAAGRALGAPVRLRYRPDGKPEADGVEVSASHSAGLTLVVTGDRRLTCDAEVALERTEEDWAGLLGADLLSLRDLLASDVHESPTIAATRVWSALECIRKTGSQTQALTLHSVHPGGWALLSAGGAQIATWATRVDGRSDPIVFAVLATRED
ncbi:type I polyketide synthase [Geodermatophilus maliterrae]|uniref:SDR family NAD(P)-dependent oxidoreductase n=1 Tax=Geodermatophilus maliterrae TaxID=3162531 RepID=A0ABV3XA36_9ACTN